MVSATKTAKTLLDANLRKRVSWRNISQNGYCNGDVNVLPGLNHATLNKFAKSKGTWIPADTEKQKLLGVYVEKPIHVKRELLPGEKETKKRIAIMAKNLRNSFKEYLP